MIGPILQFQDLQKICRPGEGAAPPRLATVEAWARKIGLRYTYDAEGGIVTTLDALNAAIGIRPAANDDKLNPADVI